MVTAFPGRGQQGPQFWDQQLKAYIDERVTPESIESNLPSRLTVEGLAESYASKSVQTLTETGRLSESALSGAYASKAVQTLTETGRLSVDSLSAAYADKSVQTLTETGRLSPDALVASAQSARVPLAVAVSTAGLTALAENAAAPLTTPTYEASGQAVHPSVEYIPGGFGGKAYWMAMTPYPGGNDDHENPSILCSDDGITWTVPAGLTNPIYPRPTTTVDDYNSDAVLHYDGRRLWCMFRSLQFGNVGTEDRLYVMSSLDGVTWTAPVLAMSNNKDVRGVLSPSIYLDPASGQWYLWGVAVTPGASDVNTIRRWQADAPTGPWGAETVVSGVTVAASYEPWHLDVRRVDGGELVLLTYSTLNGGAVAGGHLRRSVSTDGLTWVTDSDHTIRGLIGKWDQYLYKSCLVPAVVDGKSGYRLYYSAYSGSEWRIGHAWVTLGAEPRTDITPMLLGIGRGVGDTFTRPDSASIGTTTSGIPWTVTEGAPAIVNRQFSPGAATGAMTIDIGSADMEVGVTVAAVDTTAGKELWLHARRASAGSIIRLGTIGGGAWRLEAGSGPVDLIRASEVVPAAGDRIRIRAKGTDVRCYVNDRLIMRETVAAPTAGNLAAVQVSGGAGRLDDFFARPI